MDIVFINFKKIKEKHKKIKIIRNKQLQYDIIEDFS